MRHSREAFTSLATMDAVLVRYMCASVDSSSKLGSPGEGTLLVTTPASRKDIILPHANKCYYAIAQRMEVAASLRYL